MFVPTPRRVTGAARSVPAALRFFARLIHRVVVAGTASALISTFCKRLPPRLKTSSPALRYGVAILLAILAQVARLPLHNPTLIPYITYLPFILLAAAFGRLGPGLVTTFLCSFESFYFATAPVGTSQVADPPVWLGLSALALSGMVASVLFERVKRSQDQLRVAYLELQTVHRSAPIMLLVVDDGLRVRKANDLVVRFAGQDVSALIGQLPGGALGCLNALADPRGCGHSPHCAECAIRLALSDTLSRGTPHTGVEAWVPISANGSTQERCLQLSSVALETGGNARSALVCALDITPHKRAEAEMREQRDALGRQAELIDLSHDAIITADQNRVVTGWNSGAREMYGWTELEALGKVVHELLRTGGASAADIDAILSRSGRWDGELEHSHRDGSRLIVDSRQVLRRDAGGNPAGILEINRDITASRLARKQLLDAHRRTTAILESISDGFNALDREWRYVYVNAAGARFVHRLPEELLGRSLWEVWPGLEDTPFGRAYLRAVAENTFVNAEGFFQPLDAWFEVRCYPSPEGLSLFFTDVTRRKQAEHEVQRLNAELEQCVRDRTVQLESANRELETFAYSVSHDLRAPLRGIDSWSQALVEDYAGQLDETARRYLDRIRAETQQMGLLIGDLLRLSRVTLAPLEREAVDLTALARRIAGDLRETCADRCIEFDFQPGLTASGDPRLLEVALNNLLNNAAKFTGKRAEARIEVGRTEQEGVAAFFVRDNGAGFDMAYADRLFGPFQRLHKRSSFPGTGIGLATVRRIVNRHGGRIWAEAQVDRGATFFFTLEAPE